MHLSSSFRGRQTSCKLELLKFACSYARLLNINYGAQYVLTLEDGRRLESLSIAHSNSFLALKVV